ncbi:hypothetical protein QBC35DRAFT_102945 [Podospora australis]|uniref:Uncharacterized protein n=1 Tax=Podospora australis TaxID=1536484 RepID=A0AAN6X8M7_9PEZI|nr:hypothetical protein QBC35DRAFT_102945 [Podospora australis]
MRVARSLGIRSIDRQNGIRISHPKSPIHPITNARDRCIADGSCCTLFCTLSAPRTYLALARCRWLAGNVSGHKRAGQPTTTDPHGPLLLMHAAACFRVSWLASRLHFPALAVALFFILQTAGRGRQSESIIPSPLPPLPHATYHGYQISDFFLPFFIYFFDFFVAAA